MAEEVNLPLGHISQTRSLVDVAAVRMRVPAAHVVMAEQPRSLVLLGGPDSYWAAVHCVHDGHVIALL